MMGCSSLSKSCERTAPSPDSLANHYSQWKYLVLDEVGPPGLGQEHVPELVLYLGALVSKQVFQDSHKADGEHELFSNVLEITFRRGMASGYLLS